MAAAGMRFFIVKFRLGARAGLFAVAVKLTEMPIFILVGGTGIEPVTPAV
jgi:hypothetical protein